MQPTIWNDERITAYVLGELSASESSRLETEMQSNAELSRAVEDALQITTQLSAVFAAEPPMALDAVKRDEILSTPVSMNKPVAIESDTANRSWFLSMRFFSLAATVLLIGTLSTLAYRVNDASPQSTGEVAMRMPHSVASPYGAAPFDENANTESSASRGADASEKQLFFERKYSLPVSTKSGSPASPASLGPMPSEPALAESLKKQYSTELPSIASRRSMNAAPAEVAAKPQSEGESLSMAAPSSNAPYTSLRDQADFGYGGGDKQTARLERAVSLDETVVPGAATDFSTLPGGGMGMGAPIVPEGLGPGNAGDRFEPIDENDFQRVSEEPLSTFSIDVDTASYSKVRQFLLQSNRLPPAGAVRIEELVNYFDYQYEPPADESEHPFAYRVEVADCPWTPAHRLARIAIKGKELANDKRPASNLVFLVDTSGSMNRTNKLPLVKQGLQKLTERLGALDRVAIVVYAGSAGLVLDSTPASDRATILRKINQMQSGGSTNGGEGIRLAYQVARDHFIADGVNRVILCSDGNFNVGTTSNDELVRLVETESKGGIDITVLGFGMGNHNDSMMEQISGRGNGNYAFIDSEAEADRVLVEQTSGTLVTIARDVKIQVEFNPTEVAAYRLIGYENRKLANEDFKDDTKDAGEIGAGHNVTAIYELIPAKGDTDALAPKIDELRYQKSVPASEAALDGELMTVKLRYKKPDSDTSIPLEFPVKDSGQGFEAATSDFKFATAVAGFGMLLRSSEHIGNWTMSEVESVAEGAKGEDTHRLRAEFIEMVRRASMLLNSER